MMPAEEALVTDTPEIRKSKKVIAFTKSIFVAVLILSFFSTAGSVWVILDNQEKVADRILDCTIPDGACYKQKISNKASVTNAEVVVVVNYCTAQTPDDLVATRACVRKEMSK